MECVLSEIIPALSLVIDYQAKGNLYHAWRVAIISYRLAGIANLNISSMIFYSALLHDVGAFGFSEHIINYKDLPTQKSIPWIRDHPAIGAGIVKTIPGISEGAAFILEHHERYDGLGYPQGKKGDEISLEGQIIRMADSLDLLLRQEPKSGLEHIFQYSKAQRDKEFSEKLYNIFRLAFLKDKGRSLLDIDEDKKVAGVFNQLVNNINAPCVGLGEDFSEVILKVFARVIDGKHHYTHEHSQRVAIYAQEIAGAMGLEKAEIRKIKYAGYLHDLGKIAIPGSILDKPGPLTKDEWEVMRKHAPISGEIINSVNSLKDLASIVSAAQERWDGLGYPSGLKGGQAPLAARIIAVADAIDAMLSDRAYRKALGIDKARKELEENSGTQFDPEIVKAARALLNNRIGV